MSRPIEQLTAGTGIWLYETLDGTPTPVEYIYLGLDNNQNPRLLRKNAVIARVMHSTNVASYNGCGADNYLEGDGSGFLARFNAETLAYLQAATITYTDYTRSGDGSAQVLSVARRCFLLSCYELGCGGGEGGRNFLPALKAYYGVTADNTARVARKSDGSTVSAWLRSAGEAAKFRYVGSNGAVPSSGENATVANNWLRPAISLAPATPVSDDGAEEIFLLPDTHRTYWQIGFTASLGVSDRRPTRGKLFMPNTLGANDELNCWVCNNYGDAEPAWIACENNGVALFGSQKTGQHWELGVKAEARTNGPGRSVYEPAMIVETEATA
jgi:hypothetical protein